MIEGSHGRALLPERTGRLDPVAWRRESFESVVAYVVEASMQIFIVPSTDPPTGIGESSVPPIAPALANAVAALTGKRHRSLSFVV